MHCHRPLAVVLSAAALLAASMPAAAERLAWLTEKPTWKAVYVPQPPRKMDAFDHVSAVLAGDRPAATTDLLLTRLERHLEQVSEVYRGAEGYAREWGFQGPSVQIVEAGGHATYLAIGQPGLEHAGFQIACHTHPGEPSAYRRSVLGGGAPIFVPAAALDDSTEQGGSLGWRTGFTPAHELFHAIQESYPFSPPGNEQGICPHKWITEGTANAAAFGALEARGVLDFERHGPRARYFMGLRPYYIPLHVASFADTTEAGHVQARYGSSSFWRFLYERSRPRQWTYLETLFEVPIREGGSRRDSLLWLEEGFERLDWPQLHVIYPAFLTDYATWGEARFDNRGYAADWLEESFGGCRDVLLQPSDPSLTISFQMPDGLERSTRVAGTNTLFPMSGRCFRVRTAGFKQAVEVDVLAEVEELELADQLWLGADGGLVKGAARKGNGRAGSTIDAMDGYAAKRWLLGPQVLEPGASSLVVLTRARPDPGEPPGDGALELNFTAETWEAEVPEAKARDDSSPKRTKAKPQPSIPGVPDGLPDVEGADEVALEDLHTAGMIMAIDRPPQSCAGKAGLPDDAGLCGPRLVLTLSKTLSTTGLAPGRLPDYGKVMGIIRQAPKAIREGRHEGPRARLVMPAIDYGETGTYDAIIRVDYPDPDAETLATLRREVMGTDETPQEEVTGQVTVERYTPAAMSGSFSGTLFGIVRRDGEAVQVTEPISGRFTVATPVANDPRTSHWKTRAGQRFAAYMGLGATGFLRPVRSTVEQGLEEPQGPENGGGGGPGAGDSNGAVARQAGAEPEKVECVYDGVALLGKAPVAPEKCAETIARYKAFPEDKWKKLKKMYEAGGLGR